MTLVLTLEQPVGVAVERTRRVTGASFRIGRGSDCDWALPDPARRLSKQHCVLRREGSAWWVTDTSTNGLYLDDAPQPVGRDQRAPLRNGSRLRLGDYMVAVRVEEEAAGDLGSSLFDAPVGSGPPAPDWPSAAGPVSSSPLSDRGGLFDDSWAGQKPLGVAQHPSKFVPEAQATPPDHTPPDELSLSFLQPRRPVPPPLPPPPAPPIAVAGEGPFFESAPPLPPLQAAPVPVPVPRAAGDDAARLLRAFLEGAGMAADTLAAEDPEARLREAGAAFRALTLGLVQLLRTRALLKREIGVEQTLIGATGNNPLKLAVGDTEAMRAALVSRGPGYLEPPVAIERAFEDLKAHELAVMDGVQEALRALLKRFDPAELERELADGSTFAALLAGGRKAQYWDLFKSRYGELAKSAEAKFLGEAGLDFERAYQHRAGRG